MLLKFGFLTVKWNNPISYHIRLCKDVVFLNKVLKEVFGTGAPGWLGQLVRRLTLSAQVMNSWV